MKSNFIIIFIISIVLPLTKEYDVNLYGIPVANVLISEEKIFFNNHKSIKITYETTTNKFTSNLFKIDNFYETIIDEQTLRVLSFKKTTFQPNVTNNLYTNIINDTVKYFNTDTILPKNTFNIFSLLYYLSNTEFDLINNDVLVEREGLLYNCRIFKVKKNNNNIEIKLDLDLVNNKSDAIIKHTDIFTWGLFKEGSINSLLIKDREIKSCNFKSGFTNLKSSLKKEGSP